MGAGIARQLMEAGHPLVGWNRTRAKAEHLVDAGMGWADTPREAAAGADVLFTMLTNTAAVEQAAEGEDGILAGLRPGTVWADLSTISPDASVALAERVAATGASFLDTPVSGSPATLAAGQMSVMVGGDRAAYDHVEEVLHAIGPKVTYIGPNGHAILSKVAINLALVVSVTAFAEAVTLVEKAGVDREAVVDAVLKSVIASPVIGYRAPLLVDDTDGLRRRRAAAEGPGAGPGARPPPGAAVPTCSAASEMLSAARSSPLKDRDFLVSVADVYRRHGGGDRMTDEPPPPYRTTIDDVPLEQNLREDEGWVDMQVQYLIDEKTAGSRGLVVGRTVLPPGRSARPARAPERRRVPGGDVGPRRDPHERRDGAVEGGRRDLHPARELARVREHLRRGRAADLGVERRRVAGRRGVRAARPG